MINIMIFNVVVGLFFTQKQSTNCTIIENKQTSNNPNEFFNILKSSHHKLNDQITANV